MVTTSTIHDNDLFLDMTARTKPQIVDLVRRLQAFSNLRKDYVVEPGALSLRDTEDGLFAVVNHGGVAGKALYPMRGIAHEDVADLIGLCKRDYTSIAAKEPRALVEIANNRLPEVGKNLLLRLVGDTLQTIRSDVYLGVDNLLFFQAAQVAAKTAGADIIRAQFSETRFYLAYVRPDWAEDVWQDGPGTAGKGTFTRLKDDKVQPLVTASHSEVGRGGFTIENGLFHLLCKNCNVWVEVYDRTHRGQRLQAGFISAETRRKEADVILSMVSDAIRHSFDRETFMGMVEAVRTAQTTPIAMEPKEAVAKIQDSYKLSDTEVEALVNELMAPTYANTTGETVGGIVNGLTFIAQAIGERGDVTREHELVRIGGRLTREGPKLLAASVPVR